MILNVIFFILKGLGIIFLLLLALIILVLFTPVKIGFTYPKITLFVKWNGIKYNILPQKKKKNAEKSSKIEEKKVEFQEKPPEISEKTVKKQEKIPQNAPNSLDERSKKPIEKSENTKPKEENSFLNIKEKVKNIDFDALMGFLKILWEGAIKILKGTVFERLYCIISLADKDKAKLALNYGKVSSALVLLQPKLEENFKIKDQSVNLIADFEGENSNFACDIVVYQRPIKIIAALVASFIKIKKEGITYEQFRRIFS